MVGLLQLQDMTGKSQEERKALLLQHVKGKANDVITRFVTLMDEKDLFFDHILDRYYCTMMAV